MNYKIIAVMLIFFVAIYCIILGYQENTHNYNQDYIKTVGKIINKKIKFPYSYNSEQNIFLSIKEIREIIFKDFSNL